MSGTQNGRSPRSVALVGPYSSGKSALFEALMEAAGAPVKRRPIRAIARRRPRSGSVIAPISATRGRSWTAPARSNSPMRRVRAGSGRSRRRGVRAGAGTRAAVGAAAEALADQAFRTCCSSTRSTRWKAAWATRSPRLQGYAGSPLVLRQVPIIEGETVAGYVDVVSERAYRYRKGQASELIQIPSAMQDDEQEARDKLVEVLADHDDALLEKVLEDVKPTPDGIYRDLRKDLARRRGDRGAAGRRRERRRRAPPVEGAAPRHAR